MSLIEVQHRRSVAGNTNSYDARTNSFTAVISTGADVRRGVGKAAYIERLDLSQIEAASLVGLPVLNSHRSGDAKDQVGAIESAALENGVLVARIRLSSADDVRPISQRAADGLLSMSIGYTAAASVDSTETGQRVRTITPAIFEVSIVSVPADGRAKQRNMTMETEELDVMPESQAQQIRSMGELADLPPSFAEAQIEANASIEEARTAARAAMVERSAPAARIRTHAAASHDEPAVIQTRAADALAYRMGAAELPEASRPFAAMSFLDLARDSLTRIGVNTRGMSPDTVLQRAAHGTSDFPIVVSNAVNKTLLEAYQAAESPLKALARQRMLPNFKESTSLRLGGMGRLAELSEQGEIKATSRAETGETMNLSTFARRFDLTRKLMINDDTGAFGDITAALGQAAAQTEADILVSLLLDNPKLSDGKTVFHADRGNITTGLTSLNEDSLSAMRLAMRQRKDLDGKTLINAAPRYLVVGPELETAGEKLLSAIQAQRTDDVNVFAKLSLLVEPRIDDDRFYLFADPARLAGMQYAYLSGAPGPQVQRQDMWDTLGVSFRVFEDFGASWIDWRSAQFNAGE